MKRLLALLSLSFLLYCTHDKPLPSGYELLNRENKGEIIVKEYPATRTAIYWSTPQAGIQNSLMLGQLNDYKSFVALRFVNFSEIDTTTINSVTLNLEQFFHYGDGSSFEVTIYPLTDAWVPTYTYESDWETVVWDDIQGKIDYGKPIGSFTAGPSDSVSIVTVDLDTAIVNDWVRQYQLLYNDDETDDIEVNFGFILTLESADVMCQYYSAEVSGSWPFLSISYDPLDEEVEVETDTVYAYIDASLIQYDTDVMPEQLIEDPEYLQIGNASGYKTFLQFHTEDIPKEATIHHAMVTMNVVSNEDTTNLLPISVIPVFEDSLWDPEEMVLDSLHEVPTAYASSIYDEFNMSNSEATSNMSTIVQHWAWNLYNNYGLLLFSGDEGYSLSEISFYSGKNDSTLVPKLRVTYSLPPDMRFSE